VRIEVPAIVLALLLTTSTLVAQTTYLGFDRNEYPGDQNLKALRQTFAYTSYWLGNPPGAKSNSWAGKRKLVEDTGFGFLLLFNSQVSDALTNSTKAAALGMTDGQAAAAAAGKEGFPKNAVIFLDIEEGGRMTSPQKAYIYAWVDAVVAGGYRAGIYCSGIVAHEEENVTIITSDDIRATARKRKIIFWVAQDTCPPSPGCTFPKNPPKPTESGIGYADIWQFAQSPRRAEFANQCPPNYSPDNNCYPPNVDASQKIFLDVNTANSSDPSNARTR
jgi:hypothetical protein